MSYRWKRGNKKIPFNFLAVVTIIFIVGISVVALQKPAGIPFSVEFLPDLSTTGYVLVKPEATVVNDVIGVVSLTSDCYLLTANTEAGQAEAINDGLNNIIRERPMTHDLMKDMLTSLNVEVLMVKIVDIRNTTSSNNTFIGRLILKKDNQVLNLDSRPSDGIAIAVRTDAPIYIKEDLLKQQGKYIC